MTNQLDRQSARALTNRTLVAWVIALSIVGCFGGAVLSVAVGGNPYIWWSVIYGVLFLIRLVIWNVQGRIR